MATCLLDFQLSLTYNYWHPPNSRQGMATWFLIDATIFLSIYWHPPNSRQGMATLPQEEAHTQNGNSTNWHPPNSRQGMATSKLCLHSIFPSISINWHPPNSRQGMATRGGGV